MKRVYYLVLIGLAIALLISLAVSYDPGYVRISFGHWLIESNLWVLGLLNLALIAGIFLVLKTLGKVKGSGRLVSGWMSRLGSSKAKQQTDQGLVAFLEGNWHEAKRLLKRSAEKSDNPMVNYLAAAHAAAEQGDAKDAEVFLKKAYEHDKSAELAVGITQAQVQLQENQLELCLATLIRLRKQNPQHPFILKLLKTVYLKLEDWQQLINLLPELKRLEADANLKNELRSIEQLAWQNAFEQKTDELLKQSETTNHAGTLANLWRKAPESLRFNPSFIATYAQQLIRLNCQNEAEILVRKALAKDWSDELIELYGLTAAENASEQLITAENWLKQRPSDAALLLSLGRLALRNELWGKAWEYFSASYKLKAKHQTLAELCRLAPLINEDQEHNQALIKQLLDSLDLPALPLPKS